MTREERLAAAEALTGVLARVVGAAEHPTGLARATATATGELTSLDLHPAALARGPDAIGRLTVETARLAAEAAVQRSYDELAKALGDGLATAVEAFAGPPPLRASRETQRDTPRHPSPHPAPPTPPPAPGTPPRASGQPPRRASARPDPTGSGDDDDYFADPFRGQRR
ncbi:hypothetical protein [Saccharothrix lopnurensis]|uniref:YbaB/EbfC DNA-binding family protein n=1 Tax=Saccharothrix lopnurensis TaxID=1670621 RepID=A0ABW1P1S4_9PSEU